MKAGRFQFRNASFPAPARAAALVFAALLALVASASRAESCLVLPRELTVFAASSLQEAFTALAGRFEKARGIHVRLSFAGSQELRTQLEQGAQADVFASADLRHARALEEEKLLRAPSIFAGNVLVIAVPKGNPAHVRSIADVAAVKHLVIGAREVPAGAYAEKLFALADAQTPGLQASLLARVKSRELNVRQVLAKVALGEADAGIVYRTDARAMSAQVDAVELPTAWQLRADYPIGVVAAAANADDAAAFVAFVLSAEGQEALRARGFLAPAAGAAP